MFSFLLHWFYDVIVKKPYFMTRRTVLCLADIVCVCVCVCVLSFRGQVYIGYSLYQNFFYKVLFYFSFKLKRFTQYVCSMVLKTSYKKYVLTSKGECLEGRESECRLQASCPCSLNNA